MATSLTPKMAYPSLKFAANISTMFTEYDFKDRFEAAKRNNFMAVEAQHVYDYTKEDLFKWKSEACVQQVLINSLPGEEGQFGQACLPGYEVLFQLGLRKSIDYAYKLNCPRIHILAGLRENYVDLKAMETTFVNNLESASIMLDDFNLTGVIEPIASVVKQDYFLSSFEKAIEYLERANKPNIKLLLDVFHLKTIEKEKDLLERIKYYYKYCDHIQISQVPGRQEPSAKGDINFDEVFNLLTALNYDGYVGLEYTPSGSTVESLRWMNHGLTST